MEKEEAEKILREKKQAESDEIEAVKTLEEAKIKEKQEEEEAEKKRKKEEFKAEKKKYPDFVTEIWTECHKCNKPVNMSQGEHITKSSKIIIVGECLKCGSYNIAAIPTNNSFTSKKEKFFAGIDFR